MSGKIRREADNTTSSVEIVRESTVLMRMEEKEGEEEQGRKRRRDKRALLIQHCSMDFHFTPPAPNPPLPSQVLLLPALSESEPVLPNEVPSSQI